MKDPKEYTLKKASVLIVLLVTSVVAGFTQSSSNLRADGTIMLKGQPFFPFGMYSTHWTSGNSDRMKCLRTMIAIIWSHFYQHIN